MSSSQPYRAVAIGGSSGGFEALIAILSVLGDDFPLPVLVVLHREPTSRHGLAQLVASHCRLHVKEADEKERVCGGTVYLAPANYHVLVELDETLSLSVDPRVSYARPSIDVLFESAADTYRSALIGILLTGANRDGAEGLRAIRQRGGLTVAQDPTTAKASYMPGWAVEAGVVDQVLSLSEIGRLLAGPLLVGPHPTSSDSRSAPATGSGLDHPSGGTP